jgi:hypothetical protein
MGELDRPHRRGRLELLRAESCHAQLDFGRQTEHGRAGPADGGRAAVVRLRSAGGEAGEAAINTE